MKKLFIFLLMFLFLFSSVSAWQYSNSENYDDARADVLIEGTFPKCDGQEYGAYCVGDYYVDIELILGDELYFGTQYNSWSEVIGSQYGYIGIGSPLSSKSDRVYLDTSNGKVEKYIICGWDFDSADDGSWAWTGICGGYLGDYFGGLQEVECYQDSDCSSNQLCDKSGDSQDWFCKEKICDFGQNKCEGTEFFVCGDNQWESQGIVEGACGVECISEDKCEGTEYFTCSNYKYVSQGEIIGECGYNPEQPQTYYRLSNNECSQISILPSEKRTNDYTTLTQCQSKIDNGGDTNTDTDTDSQTKILPIIIATFIIIGIIIFTVIIVRNLSQKRK